MAREGMYSTFDPAPFLAALDGDRACFVEFSQPFLAALRPSVDGVLEAAAGGDGAALHERSHALKGAVSIYRAAALVAALQALESASRMPPRLPCANVLDAFSELAAAFGAELELYCRAPADIPREASACMTNLET